MISMSRAWRAFAFPGKQGRGDGNNRHLIFRNPLNNHYDELMRPSASALVCICCGAQRQIEYRSLPFCSACLSGRCQMCRDRFQKSESAPLKVCLCCGMDRQFQYRRLPFCSRCVSGVCQRCRSQVRVRISEMDPKAINLSGRIARAADAVRVGLWRETHHQPDAAAFHGLPAAANDSGDDEASSPKTQSGRAAAGSTDALWVAVPREAYRHDDAEALLSMPQTSNRFDMRSVPVGGASHSGLHPVLRLSCFPKNGHATYRAQPHHFSPSIRYFDAKSLLTSRPRPGLSESWMYPSWMISRS